MHGNTIIKSLGTTVASEAFRYVKSQAAVSFRNRQDHEMCIAEIVSEIQSTADKQNPRTIGDMMGVYFCNMSDEAYARFAKRVQREVRIY